MPRYIDADKFKNNLEKAMEKMHVIGGVKAVDVGAVMVALDRQPTADVIPKARVEEMLQQIDTLIVEYLDGLYMTGEFLKIFTELKKRYTEGAALDGDKQ